MYQSSFATDRLESHQAAWLWKSLDIIPTSAEPAHAEQATTIAGLAINGCSEVGIESGEWSEEQAGAENRQLLHAARLLHAKEHYIAQFGQVAYDIMLADCLWRVYRKNGKLGGRVYILSRG